MITAITLFALSGLIAGFAVGAFARSPKQTQLAVKPTSAPIASQKATPTPTPQVAQAMPLGCPILQATSPEIADGTTTYTLSAQVKDKSVSLCANENKSITAQGITCRLWLSKGSDNTDIPGDRLTHTNNLINPFPHEIDGGLTFDPTTPQVQPCNQGVGTWKYRIAQTVDHGSYHLMVLTDWNGQYYNWSWDLITINQAN